MDILVALDGSIWSDAVTRMAIELARDTERPTRLTAIHVVSVVRMSGKRLRDLAGFLGFEPVIVPEKVEAFYRQRGQDILDGFAEACEEAGVVHRELLEQGNVVERLVHHGDKSDLVLIGARGDRELAWPGMGGTTVERVVKNLETRALVVPQDQGPLTGILLGYDGSDGSAKALRATRHLLELVPLPVHAVYVTEGKLERDPLQEVRDHLAGLDVELHLHRMDGEPREVLVSAASEHGCNLIALGYRKRSIIGDVFLGRVTEWLLRYVPVALLISR
jgi:nucleotide-binding universal stress UspA family protein